MNEISLLDRSGLLGSKPEVQNTSGYKSNGNNWRIGAGNVTNGFASVHGRLSLGMRKF